MVAINLHGDGTQGKRFNRGFTLVAAAEPRWVFVIPARCYVLSSSMFISREREIIQSNGNNGPTIEEPSVSTGEDGKLHFFEEESDPGDNSFDRAYSPE